MINFCNYDSLNGEINCSDNVDQGEGVDKNLSLALVQVQNR